MKKTKVVKAKHTPSKLPVGGTILTYLLYEQINPQGTLKGVLLTLFITWWVIVWGLVIAQIFITEPLEPVWQEKPKGSL